jgi:hypothetical protein
MTVFFRFELFRVRLIAMTISRERSCLLFAGSFLVSSQISLACTPGP